MFQPRALIFAQLIILASCGKSQFSGERSKSPEKAAEIQPKSSEQAPAEVSNPEQETLAGPTTVPPATNNPLPSSSPQADIGQLPIPSQSPAAELSCAIPRGPDSAVTQDKMNTLVCTGNILASGSMKGSDLRDEAAANCSAANLSRIGTCCAMDLFSAGKWFLTDGVVANEGGVTGDVVFWGRSAGPCTK
jgi:hypothetical protein